MQALETSTQLYWNLATTARRGNLNRKEVSTSLALSLCSELERNLGPHRLLLKHVRSLSNGIIAGGRKAKKQKTLPSNVRLLDVSRKTQASQVESI